MSAAPSLFAAEANYASSKATYGRRSGSTRASLRRRGRSRPPLHHATLPDALAAGIAQIPPSLASVGNERSVGGAGGG